MSLSALGIDVYQLTTLIAHAAEGRLTSAAAPAAALAMNFFFRHLPHHRNYVVTAGVHAIAEHCRELRFDEEELRMLDEHPVLGPALRTPPGQAVRAALQRLDGFVGDIDALPEGTLAFAGPAYLPGGEPVLLDGVPLLAYTPLVQVRTDLVTAKLIETPWLSRLNYLSMVASKAARMVTAAREDGVARPVLELGQRRTHPQAAIDASYAAYLAGCDATSNLAATRRYGIPSVGTVDHFAIQAAERLGVSVYQTEASFFATFCSLFPHSATLLVDTYDTWHGLESAVRATAGRCTGVRLDSAVTPESVQRARALLDRLGAPHVRIIVSDSLDEQRVRALAAAGADGFGVGENIVCAPDAATGIGAVGKLVQNSYGKLTMKLARGSGKATLPGLLQAYRCSDHDLLALADEPPPAHGQPLLAPLWRGRALWQPLPSLASGRASVQKQVAALPAHLRALTVAPATYPRDGGAWPIVLSPRLHETVLELHAAAAAN